MMMIGWMVLVVGVLLVPSSQSLRFDIQSGKIKCISEDMKSNSMTVGKYQVINPNQDRHQLLPDSHKLNVKVTSSHGHIFQWAEKVEKGQFVFTAMEQGNYMASFSAPEHWPLITLTIDFDWRTGVQFKDWFNVAKKGHVDAMKVELEQLYHTINSIHEEMFYFRAREKEMQQLNQETISKMMWLSFVSLCFGFSVAGLQFWYLKSFFQENKLI
ncbi:hypothetical protein E1A91_D02G151600v1 [Gossypium mustelinum]|uniref:GOLD domain-containing protein n=1 Tax=Gossypium mustelinum TaxID=34275 RepID=A0A5D2VXR0_GOSMU|nr:hypothetical protein E1A91_D02G151600v1 [Gossypium mustelinum]